MSQPLPHDNPKKSNGDSQNPRVTILVAEDDFVNLMLIEEFLNETNVEIIHAENGQIAVDFCMQNPSISLILMDINMPIMDGFSSARKIRSFNKNIPIIAQTAYYKESDQPLGIFSDFNEFLSKPIEKKTLFEKMTKFISLSSI